MSVPDFDQKALNIVDAIRLFSPGLGPTQTKALTQMVISEQLRLMWNARGVADRAALGVEFRRAMEAGGGQIRPEEVLTALDR